MRMCLVCAGVANGLAWAMMSDAQRILTMALGGTIVGQA